MFYQGKKNLLEKKFSIKDLIFFGLGNILGPQIFLLLAGLVAITGVTGIFSLLSCMIICFLIAFVYLELSMSMPTTGFVIDSVTDAYGEFVSFIVAWSQLFGNIAFVSICAIGFGMFLGKPLVGAVLIIVVVAIMSLQGITELGRVQSLLLYAILLFLALIIGFNMPFVAVPSFDGIFGGIGSYTKVLFGIGFFFLAFTGFEDVTAYAAETKSIKRLPLAIFSVIGIISLLFILIYFVIIGFLGSGSEQLFSNPLIFLSERIFGKHAGIVFIIIGLLASFSSLIGSLKTCSRNVFSMSEKGFLPAQFAKLNKKGVPAYAVFFASVISVIIIFSGTLELIVYLSNFLYFFITIILAATLIKLREKRKLLARPYNAPLFPYLQYLTICVLIMLMFFLDLKSIAFGVIWLFFGFVIYMLRIVGEHRLKFALFGANMLTTFILAIIIYIFEEVFPEAFSAAKSLLIISLLLFLVFTFLLGLEAFNLSRKGNVHNQAANK
ncbi:MAG: APC family permease [archaeon]